MEWRSTCGRAGDQDPHRLGAVGDTQGSWDGHGEMACRVLVDTRRQIFLLLNASHLTIV